MQLDIPQWLEAGAPGAVLREIQCVHAHPIELTGPNLSAQQVAKLVNLSERCIQRYAVAAVTRETDWAGQWMQPGPDGQPQTICCGQRGTYVNAEREPLPLLLCPDGSVLRAAPNGPSFAVVAGPSLRRRGRPKTTAGESPWQFRQSLTGGSRGSFVLPSWVRG